MKLSRRKAVAALAALVIGAPVLAACGDDSSSGGEGGTTTVNLGFFPNITHATALVGLEKGIFAEKLGSNVEIAPKSFNAGPAAIEALFAKGVDATFIGPNPAINAWAQSKGQAIKIVSGAASGGVSLVVDPDKIKSLDDLRGKKIATPQLGNTQDVALRSYLKTKGLTANKDGSGDVSVVPQENSQTIDTFKQGAIDGAWVPEPFASRLILESGGEKLLNEKELWPDGKFVITHLIVRQEFAEEHPDIVKKLVEGTVAANDYINGNLEEAKTAANGQLEKLSGKPLSKEVLDSAFKEIEFLSDPIPASLVTGAENAEAVGLLEPVDLKGIYDLSHLNEILKAAGKPEVATP
ncbi:ABC transporter substrate-binding protein [Actinocorallia populi]|uniref:ABC transporter substrate-binding protein n=1 Tax=Actinocorallia populi TaxID=2079200 RepID=UPI000D097C10|nr:ABC transporter substrate-binding protein [Actinocorallia populi]